MRRWRIEKPPANIEFAGGFVSVREMIRTLDLLIRSQTLYPAELRAHIRCHSDNEIYYSTLSDVWQVFFETF